MSKRRTPDEEAATAAYYDARMGDWEETSEPVSALVSAKPKSVGGIVTVRFPADEAALLRQIAREEGRTQSDVIRRAVEVYGTRKSPRSGGGIRKPAQADTGTRVTMHPDIEATTRPTIKVVLEDAGTNWGAYAPSVAGVAGIGATAEAARQSLEKGLTIYFDELYADGLAAIRAEVARMAAQ